MKNFSAEYWELTAKLGLQFSELIRQIGTKDTAKLAEHLARGAINRLLISPQGLESDLIAKLKEDYCQ